VAEAKSILSCCSCTRSRMLLDCGIVLFVGLRTHEVERPPNTAAGRRQTSSVMKTWRCRLARLASSYRPLSHSCVSNYRPRRLDSAHSLRRDALLGSDVQMSGRRPEAAARTGISEGRHRPMIRRTDRKKRAAALPVSRHRVHSVTIDRYGSACRRSPTGSGHSRRRNERLVLRRLELPRRRGAPMPGAEFSNALNCRLMPVTFGNPGCAAHADTDHDETTSVVSPA
jgi:hypothetical protein